MLDLGSGNVIAEEAGEPRGGGFCPVGFSVEMQFDLESGKAKDWERLRIADFD